MTATPTGKTSSRATRPSVSTRGVGGLAMDSTGRNLQTSEKQTWESPRELPGAYRSGGTVGIRSVERKREDESDVQSMTMGSGWPEQLRALWSTDRLLELTADCRPWYGYIHYYDTHTGYNCSKEHLEAVQGRSYEDGNLTIGELKQKYPKLREVIDARLNYKDIDTVGDLKRRYDASIRTVDEQIGHLLETLKRRGELEDTAIIITSDHGECLTEHGVLFNHAELYDESWRVPLLVDAPRFEGTETRFVQYFDVLPTVLDLLDRSYRSEQFDGVSLVPDGKRSLSRDAVFAEQTHDARRRAIRTDRFKYIRRLEGDRNGHCSHLDRPDEVLPGDGGRRVGERGSIASQSVP